MSGRQPDMNLTAYDKTRKVSKQCGVAWVNDDGTIAIALDPGSALVYNQDVVYKLWPKGQLVEDVPLASESTSRRYDSMRPERSHAGRMPSRSPSRPSKPGFDDMDDDIPF